METYTLGVSIVFAILSLLTFASASLATSYLRRLKAERADRERDLRDRAERRLVVKSPTEQELSAVANGGALEFTYLDARISKLVVLTVNRSGYATTLVPRPQLWDVSQRMFCEIVGGAEDMWEFNGYIIARDNTSSTGAVRIFFSPRLGVGIIHGVTCNL